jgi:hypothetical protein
MVQLQKLKIQGQQEGTRTYRCSAVLFSITVIVIICTIKNTRIKMFVKERIACFLTRFKEIIV